MVLKDSAVLDLEAELFRELREPVPVQDLEHGPALLGRETNLLGGHGGTLPHEASGVDG